MNGFACASAFFASGLLYADIGFPYDTVDILLGIGNAVLVLCGAIATTYAM